MQDDKIVQLFWLNIMSTPKGKSRSKVNITVTTDDYAALLKAWKGQRTFHEILGPHRFLHSEAWHVQN